MAPRRDNLYGRRKGKPLSARRARLMANEFKTLAIDIDSPPPGDIGDLFPGSLITVSLEIGFGGGEHLLAGAARAPETGFIGVEPYINGMARAVAAIVDGDHRNVRLFGGEATRFLDWLPRACIDRVDLLYPDPWPKKRHWKRRFVTDENIGRLARVVKTGGTFRFASDSASYVEWTLLHLLTRDGFAWTAEKADDWRRPSADWPGTRYEAKAIAAGRAPTYLVFSRL